MADRKSELEEFAERYGYVRVRCRIHGASWSDNNGCDYCETPEAAEYEKEKEED